MLAAALAIVLVAGFIRGMTGFGFALIAAIGLGLIWSPEVITPSVLLVELVLTLVLLKEGAGRHLDPPRLVPLMLGGLAGVVVGTFGFKALPGAWLRPALELAVLISAAVSLLHISSPRLDRRWIAALVGAIVGTLVAAFAVGGPFVVVWYLALGDAPTVVRSNIIVFFGFVDLAAILIRAGVVGIPDAVWWSSLVMLPAAVAGSWLGARAFRRVDAAWWRRIVSLTIIASASLSLGHSLLTRM